MINNLLQKVSGDTSFSLRHRILNSLFFIFATYLFITAVTNLFIEENTIIRVGTFAASFMFYLFFYLSRIKKFFFVSHFIAVFVLLLLFVYHKYDGGIACGTGFYIVITAIGIMAIFKGKAKVIYMLALSAISVFLVGVEILIPSYVVPIAKNTCFVNNILAVLLTGVSASLLIHAFVQTYEGYALTQEKLSFTDHLTGLLNRRAFLFELKNKIPLFNRRKIPFCLIMFDFDNFKWINDSYGHNCGDKVLIEVSETVSSLLKSGDVICRWGGEEFLIFLPYSNLKQGESVAERLRKAVEKLKITFNGVEIPITITLGVKEFDENFSVEKNIELADMAMYRGKQSGKNTVFAF